MRSTCECSRRWTTSMIRSSPPFQEGRSVSSSEHFDPRAHCGRLLARHNRSSRFTARLSESLGGFSGSPRIVDFPQSVGRSFVGCALPAWRGKINRLRQNGENVDGWLSKVVPPPPLRPPGPPGPPAASPGGSKSSTGPPLQPGKLPYWPVARRSSWRRIRERVHTSHKSGPYISS